jgi:hypothetical protein
MFNKNIDKRMTELYKYSVNRTAEVDKLLEDLDIQLSKIHQFNAEVRTALKDALDRIKKLEVVVKELERWDPVGDEWEKDYDKHCKYEDEELDYISFLDDRIRALADYLKVEFKEEGIRVVKK